MSVKEKGVTSMSLISSWGTLARRHNSVIKIENAEEVHLCLALIAMSCSIRSPMSMLFRDMIDPRHASLGWRRINSFRDGMIVLLIKANQKRAATLKSLFSIGAIASIHLEVVSEIRGAS
ncbi:hypothetical protein H5410_046473 [Solanum commersonii]|uniref:Uncharacterized protein n=1 Tax=Solanum commersonii TaxID=4109 RepID=A0A9J5XEJ0_SOLCO|nr:hypothetical protein H5410_046473 [Solanum commersonii]